MFQLNNGILQSLSTIDLGILNTTKLQTFGNKICMTYQGQMFNCKNIPSSKTSTKNKHKIRLYENYLSSIDDYFRQNRQIFLYNTELQNYFNLLNESKKNISAGKYYIDIEGKKIATTDFEKQYELLYQQVPYEDLVDDLGRGVLGEKIVEKYRKWKLEYLEKSK
jgi:hypothetical protein